MEKENIGILGKKLAMTQIPFADGKFVEVTAVLVTPNFVSLTKTKERDGYDATQLAFQDCRAKSLNKPLLGHLNKENINPKRYLREIKNMKGFAIGSQLNSSVFKEGERIKITGTSKGKGFAGPIKRHNFSCGPMAHGSGYHRGVGSLCTGRNPNRTFKGKKMAGHMGNEKISMRNLEIVKIENEIILIRGGIPGPKNGLVVLCK